MLCQLLVDGLLMYDVVTILYRWNIVRSLMKCRYTIGEMSLFYRLDCRYTTVALSIYCRLLVHFSFTAFLLESQRIPIRSKKLDEYFLLTENLSKEKRKRDDGEVVVGDGQRLRLKSTKVIYEKTALEEEDRRRRRIPQQMSKRRRRRRRRKKEDEKQDKEVKKN